MLKKENKMKSIKKYYIINASPEDVYAALTVPLTIELWTGYPAVMSTEPGSEFELWDASIEGKNLEFEQNKKIVQEWPFGDDISIVTIKLHEHKNGTSVELRHDGIPDSEFDDMLHGWDNYYFGALEDFFDI
jgi:activator of HSP90 ATPase